MILLLQYSPTQKLATRDEKSQLLSIFVSTISLKHYITNENDANPK